MSINLWVDHGVVVAPVASDEPGQPSVLYETGAQILSGTVFKMWFGTTAGVCYAESTDGLAWTRYGSNPVISEAGHGYPRIFKNGSTYYCYTGTVSGPIKAYTSTDGITWSLQNASALAISQAWETSSFFGQLSIAGQAAGTWYGYYTSWNATGNNYALGQATSTDLLTWTKNAGNPTITYGTPSDLHVHLVNGTYYGWTQIVQPGIPAFGSGSLPSDITRFSASSPAGPWTPLATPTSYRTQAAEGIGLTKGQWADPTMVEALGNVYMYVSVAIDGTSSATQISCAIAPSTTLSAIVQGYEGMLNIPMTSNAGLALNLTTLASDNFQRADVNPLAGNWTQVSTTTWKPNQIVSHNVEPTQTSANCASFYNAVAWPNDQWASVTMAAATTASVGVALRCSTANAQTEYIFFWPGPAGGLGNAAVLTIGKQIAGTFTALFTTGTTYVVNIGDVLTASVIGTQLSLYLNGNLVLTGTDASIASGAAGLIENSTVIANAQISAWAGGGVATPTIPSLAGNAGSVRLRRRKRLDVI